jgi:hypothetical protein
VLRLRSFCSFLLLAVLLGVRAREPSTPHHTFAGDGWEATLRGEALSLRTASAPPLPTLELRPARVERGGEALGRLATGWRVDAKTVHVDHDGWTARFTPQPQGVELSWSFPIAPPGPGPLVVAVPASDVPRVGRAGRVRLGAAELGPATWVDATGRQTAIAPRTEAGETRYVVSEVLLDESTFPAVLDPLLSPALTRLDPTGAVGPLEGDHVDPVAAFNGSQWLLAWVDDDSANGDVLATFVDATSGAALNAPPLRVGSGTSSNALSRPAVAAGPSVSGFLVVWEQGGIRAARVSATGQVAPPFIISPSGIRPSVAFSSANGRFLVTWSNPASIQAAWVDPMANSSTPANVPITTGVDPSVACSPMRCLVAFTIPGLLDIGGLFFDGPAQQATPVSIQTATGTQSTPQVSWDGSTWVVTWRESPLPGNDTFVASVFDAGVFMQLVPSLLSPGSYATPTLDCGQGQCSLVFTNTVTPIIEEVRFSPASPTRPRQTLSSAGSRASGGTVSFGPAGGGVPPRLFAWSESRGGTGVIVARREPSPGSASVVSLGPASQAEGALAPGADGGALAVWIDTRNDPGDVFGRVIVFDGGARGPSFLISAEPGEQSSPAAAWNGTDWLVVYGDGARRLVARKVSANGVVDSSFFGVIDPDAGIGTAPRVSALAAVGDRFYVTWIENRAVFGARVTPGMPLIVEPLGGERLSPPTPVTCDHSAVASNGRSWLVVSACSTLGQFTLEGVEVSTDGGQRRFFVDAGATFVGEPAVAGGPVSWLVTWTESPALNGNIAASIITGPGLTLGPPFAIAATPSLEERFPSAAWSDWGFVVTWQEGGGPARLVRGVRLTQRGPQPFGPIGAMAGLPSAAPVACLAPGRCTILLEVDAQTSPPSRHLVRREVRNAPPMAMDSMVSVRGTTPFAFDVSEKRAMT